MILKTWTQRFKEYQEAYNKEKDKEEVSEQLARISRNWIQELDNILSYDPIFTPDATKIETEEEKEINQLFNDTAEKSIEMWKNVISRYHGGMSKKLKESLKNYKDESNSTKI